MEKKMFFSILGLISLLSGATIYILFRENTYIAIIADEFIPFTSLRQSFSFLASDFLKFYFVDYLWAFSLCCFLYVIHSSSFRKCVLYTVVVLSLGIIWEILQALNFISGTADIIDVIMYLIACLTAIIIKLKRSKENEKN